MDIRFFLSGILCLVLTCSGAQNTTFQKIFSPATNPAPFGLAADGNGYVIAGSVSGHIPYMRRVDLQGNLVWEKQFDLPVHSEFYTITATADGGWLLTGRLPGLPGAPDHLTLVVKTDGDGNIVWSKSLNGWSGIATVDVLADGYLLTGAQSGDTFGSVDGAVTKIDFAGNVIWSRTYGRYSKTVSFQNTHRDGNFLYAYGQVNPDGFPILVKTAFNSGFVESVTRIQAPVPMTAHHLYPSADGNFFVTGSRWNHQLNPTYDDQPWVKKIDKDGAVLWTRLYASPQGHLIHLESTVPCSDGGLLLAVHLEGLEPRGSAGIIKLDADGDVEWTQYFGGDQSEHLSRGLTLTAEGYLLAGVIDTDPAPNLSVWSGYLLKTDLGGNLSDCCNRSFEVTVDSITEGSEAFFLDDGQFLQDDFPYANISATAVAAAPAYDYCPFLCPPPACNAVLSLGADITICKDSTIVLHAGATFPQVTWQDGSADSVFFATEPGVYWVAVTDSCGVTQHDTISITRVFLPAIAINDITLCPGETSGLTVSGYDAYQWSPASALDCSTCATVELQPTTSTTYSVYAQSNLGCSVRDTFEVTVFQSEVQAVCPPAVSVTAAPGNDSAPVQYGNFSGSTDCLCGGFTEVVDGPASGSNFPIGTTLVCYSVSDACGGSASCCTPVTVIPADPPCDVKVAGCMIFELLSISVHPDGYKTVRVRATNTCSLPVKTLAFQVPAGVSALEPADNSVYTAPSGRTYRVKNPGFTPFNSVRFKTEGHPGIADNLSDYFEYMLPPQAEPEYILAYAQLSNQAVYEAHFTTVHCYEAESGDRSSEKPAIAAGLAYPNPNNGSFFIDRSAWNGSPLYICLLNNLGNPVLEMHTSGGTTELPISVPESVPAGLYHLVLRSENGDTQVQPMYIQR